MSLYSEDFLTVIDTPSKAYLLGWIAGSGTVVGNNTSISILHDNLSAVMMVLAETYLNISSTTTATHTIITIDSATIAADVINHLYPVIPTPLVFPDAVITLAFIRGLLDSAGAIELVDEEGRATVSIPYPTDAIFDLLTDPSYYANNNADGFVFWKGVNAVDFLSILYENAATLRANHNYQLAQAVLNVEGSLKYIKALPEAVAPSKSRASDTGYDLHLVSKVKEEDGVHYYDTGIKVQPPAGMYFDLVGRSSISKTGYMLANNIGIIDEGYQGSVIVALVKINPLLPDLVLPVKLVQLVARRRIHLEVEEVVSFEGLSNRGDSGGVSSQFVAQA